MNFKDLLQKKEEELINLKLDWQPYIDGLDQYNLNTEEATRIRQDHSERIEILLTEIICLQGLVSST